MVPTATSSSLSTPEPPRQPHERSHAAGTRVSAVMMVAHHDRTEAAALARAAQEWLEARGHTAWMPAEDAEALHPPPLRGGRAPRDAELVLSLGGDGTMLRTVKILDGAPMPIIGVNVGLLGYLTEVDPPALTTAQERYFSGDYASEERMMLSISIDRVGEAPSPPLRALNEAVLEKQEAGHTVRLLVSIDGAPFTSYAADGLIVATPTGSTAYSLSARGPVVSPTHRAMLMTPVSPHMLFDRSLVLDPEEPIEIEVIGHRPANLSVDGQIVTSLQEGDTVHFT